MRGSDVEDQYQLVAHDQETMMTVTVSAARLDLVSIIARVNRDRTEVEIVSRRGAAVLMSKAEYDALVETSYLLRSPENARRLVAALKSARVGETDNHQLLEP